jgi:exosome complex component CSL4
VDRVDGRVDSEFEIKMNDNKQKTVLPGDALAISEEFLPGKNAYDADGTIRALLAGSVVKDLAQREVTVNPVTIAKTPAVGDVVIGQVEAAQTSTAHLKIYYLNGAPKSRGFEGAIFLRDERGGRGMRRTQVKLGDVVRATVVSTMNGMIQLSISEPHLGVIATMCSNCGNPLTRGERGARCEACGNMEDRKFADDFGREPIQP